MQEFFAVTSETERVSAEMPIQSTDDGNPVKLERLVHGTENREPDPVQVTHKPGVQMNFQEGYDGEDSGDLLPDRIDVCLGDRV